ncbi:MAG: VCBS repeat-containing protein [Verrucomicrobia bacterium]|nr:VCBS repeat-containing protein [Verrucomicrobiota bacterium]
MRTIIVALAGLLFTSNAYGQGAIYFNNHIPGEVEARVLLSDGSGVGAGWTAQIWARAEESGHADLQPLTPTTTFRASGTHTLGYVEPVDVTLPGILPGAKAILVMRAFNGGAYVTSPMRGESPPIMLVVGGEKYPPVNLTGLQGFTVARNPDLFTITASAGANGSVTPQSVIKTKGESQTFNAIPNANFAVHRWSLDGSVVQEGGATFTLTNIQAAHGVSVSFKNFVADGTVWFNNHVLGEVEARVLLPNGMGVGAGWTAQLYGGPEGGRLVPLHPVTTFRTASAATAGYVEPVQVSVPEVPPGAKATLVMTAYYGDSFESAGLFGQSKPITVTLGGGIYPPANLIALEGFTITSRVPIFLSQPGNVTVALGSSASFSAVAIGAEPLSYQWSFHGQAILGASTPSYALSKVQLSDAGAYAVTVRNSYGEATSAAATLTVLPGTAKGDFNGDTFADLIFQNEDGFLAVWFMDGARMMSASLLTPNRVSDPQWRIAGTGDFNLDGHEDLLLQHREGTLAVWYLDGAKLQAGVFLDPNDPKDEDWRVASTGDFNSDGKVDLLFQHDDGTLAAWLMNGVKLESAAFVAPDHPGDKDWRVVGSGDIDGDGKSDLLFQHEDGSLAYWSLDGVKLRQAGLLNPYHPRDKHWRVASVVDLNHDGKQDLIFQHKGDGTLAAWFMNGINLSSAQLLNPSQAGGSWQIVAP